MEEKKEETSAIALSPEAAAAIIKADSDRRIKECSEAIRVVLQTYRCSLIATASISDKGTIITTPGLVAHP